MSHPYRRRTWADRNRPRVLDVASELTHESGPVLDPAWAPGRVAVLAHWSVDPTPSRSVVAMLTELDAGGYETVLVSAGSFEGSLGRVCTWAPGSPALPAGTTVLRRPNLGYDFGSWASVLEAFPGVRRAERVLLVNDSLIGPFSSLAPILADFEACLTPVWGLSGSLQHRPHIQSFFVGFRDGVLDDPGLRAFWTDVRVESRKAKIVRYDELGLSEVLDEAGIGWRTMFTPQPDGTHNPTLAGADELVAGGFPFLKPGADVATHTERLDGWRPADERPESAAMNASQRLRMAWDIEGISVLWRVMSRWRNEAATDVNGRVPPDVTGHYTEA